ncbi:thermonuclease family protein [Exiguobacterium alkaliphilum]|uniref:thermonuclease family protein n=1 Tax=Exiguobacterium alkaliphilum TaxID=1428684 RepID=UPI001BA944A2|nr:thermonuclease family protein [Exiguobacterium alkaliphilum]QUE85598.1 thermonuclease family protein [Exiguobacterium alkaliphilum]
MRQLKTWWYWTLVLVLTFILSGCTADDWFGPQIDPPESLTELEADYPSASVTQQVRRPVGKTETVTLDRVVDGDTLKVEFENGATESIRLLLVDTPETSHPTLPVQPFGEAAKAFVSRWLPEGDTITLEYDVGRYDRYQRTLAYVWYDGVMVNEELLRRGLARVAYVYAPNTQHVDAFRDVERAARRQLLGIWSLENYVTGNGFDHEATDPAKSTRETDECDIKGNINRDGEKIYHVPGGASYERTVPEVLFCTEREAEAAGFRKAAR